MSFLASKLKFAANRHADKIAFVHDEQCVSYGDFYSRVVKLTNGLRQLGLKKGDRVAVLLPNCVPAVEVDAACVRAGLVRVPLNARLAPQELVGMLENADAQCIVTVNRFLDAFAEANIVLTEQLASLDHVLSVDGVDADGGYQSLIDSSDDADIIDDIDDDHVYGLFYTSGTSGVLKAAMLTHRNWRTMVRYSGANLPPVDNVNAFVAPITHAAGASLTPSMLNGGLNILLNGFEPEALMKTIEDNKVTNLLLVPTMINMLMQLPDVEKYDLSSLHCIVYGTAPFAPDRIEGAVKLFGPILRQGYGQTESCGMISALPAEDHLGLDDPKRYARLSSAGIPLYDCEVRVVDEEGADVPVGESGEIILRGDNVMSGYWRSPELTAETLIDGWLYTRDMGRFDEDGYLYLVDRKSDMIISGGYNIYPQEIENVLSTHPAVYEAAVVGVPDDTWGESVKAVVVLRPGTSATEEEVIEHCMSSLSSMKKPKSVDFVDELPKSAVGKILRRKVKEPYWAGRERNVN